MNLRRRARMRREYNRNRKFYRQEGMSVWSWTRWTRWCNRWCNTHPLLTR